jgi:hypothetical protein
MVGAVRFELTTSCTRNKRASQATLRPDPEREKVPPVAAICNLQIAENAEMCARRKSSELVASCFSTGASI